MSVGARVNGKSKGNRVGKSIKELGVLQKWKGNTTNTPHYSFVLLYVSAGHREGSLWPEALVQVDACLVCPSQCSYPCLVVTSSREPSLTSHSHSLSLTQPCIFCGIYH